MRSRCCGPARREIAPGWWTARLYLGRVLCRGGWFQVLGADAVGAVGAVRGAGRVAARIWDREGHRAEVGQPVPDLDPAGRAGPGRGVLGGGAAGRAAASAPVPADPRRPGPGGG